MSDDKKQEIPWKKVVYYEWVDESSSQFSANRSAFAPYCGQQNGTLGYFITEAEAEEFMRLREEKLGKVKSLLGYFRFSCLKCGLPIPDQVVDITIPVVMYTCPTCDTKAQWRIVCS